MNAIIIYYSRSGNTEKNSKTTSVRSGCHMYGIS